MRRLSHEITSLSSEIEYSNGNFAARSPRTVCGECRFSSIRKSKSREIPPCARRRVRSEANAKKRRRPAPLGMTVLGVAARSVTAVFGRSASPRFGCGSFLALGAAAIWLRRFFGVQRRRDLVAAVLGTRRHRDPVTAVLGAARWRRKVAATEKSRIRATDAGPRLQW